jgi:hypothetical protein
MNDDSFDLVDEADSTSALATSEGIAFRYEVLIASLTGKILGALNLLLALICVAFGAGALYFIPTRFEIGEAARPFIPSLLVILIFAIASTARYTQILRTARSEASVALNRQMSAQRRVQEDVAMRPEQ